MPSHRRRTRQPPEQLVLFTEDALDRTADDGITRLRRELERLRRLWRIGPAEVRLSRRRLTGGVIHYGVPHRIVISAHMSEEDQRETLLHEVAHAICWTRDGDAREGHGRRFWSVAKALGVERRWAPETEALASWREKRAVHVYQCEGCGETWRRIRPFRRAMECVACSRAGRAARLRKLRRRQASARSTP